MKYIALLSGGKDSCYNLVHCSANGHVLIAAASLGPEHGKEELDSYLYQTVGQDAIQLVADALEVPLYRRVISGAAVEQGTEYGGRNPGEGAGVLGDETEDLYELLSSIKESYPDVQGVSVGAILSNYQRVRVEHVCRRLSLTPLCYLWQRDQAELLSEMIAAGMEAILIKVAGIGLGAQHLGKTLAEMQPTLTKLKHMYGSHICGEGGEYETLTLDCPVFKHRINLKNVETVIHSDNDFATVAYLRVKEAVIEPKSGETFLQLIVPPLLSEELEEVRNAVTASLVPSEQIAQSLSPATACPPLFEASGTNRNGRWVAVANITSHSHSPDLSLEDEVRDCFCQLQDRLSEHALRLSNCANINIFLSSMEFFARVNAVYAGLFGTSPPSRACVAVDLPPHLRFKLDAIAFVEQDPSQRQALHVQGLSYWAPANIGPYSQAIVADERIFVSGQIGLIPSNLSLPQPVSLALETALSFQHVDRITTALKNNAGGGWEGQSQGILYWLANAQDVPHVRAASEAHPGDAGVPVLYVVVPALPKGAIVEKQVILHTGRCSSLDEDGEMVTRKLIPVFGQGDYEGSDAQRCHWEMTTYTETNASVAVVCFRDANAQTVDWLHRTHELAGLWSHVLSIRLLYRPSMAGRVHECHEQFLRHLGKASAATYIPCRYIATKTRDNWDYAMFIVGC